MTTIRCLTLAVAIALPLFAAGCGKPAIVSVRGKITYRNYPVPNGVIVLTPDHKGPLAVGRIANDGSFVIYTGDQPGAYPGKYHFTVSALAAGTTTSENSGRFEFPNTWLPASFREHNPAREIITLEPNQPKNLEIDLGS